MGLENGKCNNCGGQLQISRYLEGSRTVIKTKCVKCQAEGYDAGINLPEWFMLEPNGKPKRRLA
jgi:ssDNA-binding Zn-finger/Zn-ribbon topoisomerase 1